MAKIPPEFKELGKGVIFVLAGLIMYPLLVFLDWGWPKWWALWGRSKMDSVLFVIFAPLMLICAGIAWVVGEPWSTMMTG